MASSTHLGRNTAFAFCRESLPFWEENAAFVFFTRWAFRIARIPNLSEHPSRGLHQRANLVARWFLAQTHLRRWITRAHAHNNVHPQNLSNTNTRNFKTPKEQPQPQSKPQSHGLRRRVFEINTMCPRTVSLAEPKMIVLSLPDHNVSVQFQANKSHLQNRTIRFWRRNHNIPSREHTNNESKKNIQKVGVHRHKINVASN